MDEEGFRAVAFLDVGFGDTGLEVENCIARYDCVSSFLYPFHTRC